MKPQQSILSAKLFFQSRPNWDPHSLPRRPVCPPFGSGGGDILACGRGGWGVPMRMRGQTLWYSRYICTLCMKLEIHPSFQLLHHLFAYCSPNAEQGLRSILQLQAHSGPTLPQGRRRVQFCGRDTPDIFEHEQRCVSMRNSHCTLRPDTFRHPIFPGIKIAFQPGTYLPISFVVFLFS
jgi:hypothetical protein